MRSGLTLIVERKPIGKNVSQAESTNSLSRPNHSSALSLERLRSMMQCQVCSDNVGIQGDARAKCGHPDAIASRELRDASKHQRFLGQTAERRTYFGHIVRGIESPFAARVVAPSDAAKGFRNS